MDFDSTALDVAVTDLGNLTVVGPAAVLVWVWLARRRGLRAAIRFQWPVATVFVAVVALKMLASASGGALQGTPLALSRGAPSGHMAMATVVYGGVALMLLRRGPEPINLLTAVLAGMTLIGIGITRVVLQAHTPADVAAGLLIGALGAVWAGQGAEAPARESTRDVAELVLLLVGIVVLMHLSGFHFDSGTIL